MTARPEIPDEHYGKWATYVHEMKAKSGVSPVEPVVAKPILPAKPASPAKTNVSPTKVPSSPLENTVSPFSDAANNLEASLSVNLNRKSNSPSRVFNVVVKDSAKVKSINADLPSEDVDEMFSRLRGQGVVISATTLPMKPNAEISATKSKMNFVSEPGRGRGRDQRKNSLN